MVTLSNAHATTTHSRNALHPPPCGIILLVWASFVLHELFTIAMNGHMDAARQLLLRHEPFSWEDYKRPTPTESLLSHARQCWIEFCDDHSISDPEAEFKELCTTGGRVLGIPEEEGFL